MVAKSIVDIDLRAGEFEKFAELFNRYNEELKKQPQLWQQVGKQHTALATQFEKTAAAMTAADKAVEARKDDEKRQLDNLKDRDQLWTHMSRASETMYRNVVGIGVGMLKWGGIIAGVGAAAATGGLFGFDRLAGGIAGTRQAALGYGVSPAQLQAFSVHLSRFVDPNAYLGQVTTMETDITQRRAWYALMGGRAMSGNTTQDALSFLNAARVFALRTPVAQLGTLAGAYGLPFSVEELMRMRQTGNTEWAQQIAGATRDARSYGLSSSAALAAQNFTTAMARNRTQMMDSLWMALSRLSGPLTSLSNAFTHAAVAVLGSPAVKDGIDSLAKWLKSFSGTLDSSGFSAKMKSFTFDAGIVAEGVHLLAGAFKIPVEAARGYQKSWNLLSLAALKINQFGTINEDWARNFFTTAGQLVPSSLQDITNTAASRSAAQLRSLDLLGGMPGIMPGAAPAITAAPLQTPQQLKISILNATGGSAVVALNGLAGQ